MNDNRTSRHRLQQALSLFLSCLIFSSFSLNAADRGLYRWVDDKGVVHYGDHIPAQFAKKERQVLNKQAIVVETLAAQKTKAQLALEAKERARQAELRRLAAEKAHKDRILLATYSGTQDIDNALQQAHTKIDNRLNVIDINIGNLKKQEITIMERIEYFASNTDEADENTISNLESQLLATKSELENSNNLKQNLNSDKSKLKAQFDNDKSRFLKLRLQNKESTMAETHPLL